MPALPDVPELIAKATKLDPRSVPFADYLSLVDQIATGHIFPTVTLLLRAHRQGYGNPAHQRLVREFFVKEFTRDVPIGHEYRYKASSALSSLLLSRQTCDGIAYPAMRSQRLDVNGALKPSSAASKSTIRQVDVVEAIRQSEGNIAVKRLHVSDVIERDGTTR